MSGCCCISVPITIIEWILNKIYDKHKRHIAFQDVLNADYIERKLHTGLMTKDTPVAYVDIKNLLNKKDAIYEAIVFIEIKLLHDDDVGGRQLQSSSTRAGEKEFNWNPHEKFQFIINKPSKEQAQLLISAYEYVPKNSKPELLGEKILKLNTYELNQRIEETIKLKDPRFGKSNFELEVDIEIVSAWEAASRQTQKVYEYQRYRPLSSNWEEPYLPTDPHKWFSTQRRKQVGTTSLETCADQLREGWTVQKNWYVEGHDKNPDGWEYAAGFNTALWFSETQTGRVCRRRTWQRQIINATTIKKYKISNDGSGPSPDKGNRQNMNITANQNTRRPNTITKDNEIVNNPVILNPIKK
jgi:hypothetical protein